MRAMVLNNISQLKENPPPLQLQDVPDPSPGEGEVLIRVSACGVCHTELDEIEGRMAPPSLPVIPGHQVVGEIVECGPGAEKHSPGDRAGVAWIYSACGRCKFCLSGNENLCPDFTATGRDVDGGYAELMTVPEGFALKIPESFSDHEAAPLLCAGAIGYRSLRLTGIEDGQKLGLTGFGASGHLVLKLARSLFPESPVSVFCRNLAEREFALELGAAWAGDTNEEAPAKLDAIIDTTPVWKPVVEALANLEPGGRLVINAIRKEDVDKDYLLNLDYPTHLWMEKEIKSVANVARKDVSGFLSLAAEFGIQPNIEIYTLKEANQALLDLKHKKIRGAKVLDMKRG